MAGGTLCAFIASITPGSAASRSPDLHEGGFIENQILPGSLSWAVL